MMKLFVDSVAGQTNDSWQTSIAPILALLALPIALVIWLVRKYGWGTEFSIREKVKGK